jgi:hypothetical protein
MIIILLLFVYSFVSHISNVLSSSPELPLQNSADPVPHPYVGFRQRLGIHQMVRAGSGAPQEIQQGRGKLPQKPLGRLNQARGISLHALRSRFKSTFEGWHAKVRAGESCVKRYLMPGYGAHSVTPIGRMEREGI